MIDLVTVRAKIIAETDHGIRIEIDNAKIWLPLDEIEVSQITKDGLNEISMPEWLAEDRGLS